MCAKHNIETIRLQGDKRVTVELWKATLLLQVIRYQLKMSKSIFRRVLASAETFPEPVFLLAAVLVAESRKKNKSEQEKRGGNCTSTQPAPPIAADDSPQVS